MNPATNPDGVFEQVDLDRIDPSHKNPRKTFDPVTLSQLADSIAVKGVLEPVLVRPRHLRVVPGREGGKPGFIVEALDPAGHVLDFLPDSFRTTQAAAEKLLPRYELVAGERRYRASKIAVRPTIPAIIRDLTDREAAEVRVIENDQREDVPPLEQAAGYQELIDLGDDVAGIAAKIGRPEKYVAARLALTRLIAPLRDDLAAGKLPFGHAHVLARLQPRDQETFLDNHRVYDHLDHPHPIARLREWIRHGVLADLSAAPWKKDDATLVPAAGACKTCPKRSGANPTLFDELLDGEAGRPGRDFCTDVRCYNAKRTAFVELTVAKVAQDEGTANVLKVTESYSAVDKGVLTRDRYEVLDKKAAKLLPASQVETAVVVEGEDAGKIVQVRVKSGLPAVHDAAEDRRRAEEEAEARLFKAVVAKCFAAIATERCDDADVWTAATKFVLNSAGQGGRKHLVALLGTTSEVAIPAALAVASDRTRIAVVVTTLLYRNNPVGDFADLDAKAIVAACGVDPKRLKAELDGDQRPGAVKPKVGKAPKARKAAKVAKVKAKVAGKRGRPRKVVNA